MRPAHRLVFSARDRGAKKHPTHCCPLFFGLYLLILVGGAPAAWMMSHDLLVRSLFDDCPLLVVAFTSFLHAFWVDAYMHAPPFPYTFQTMHV